MQTSTPSHPSDDKSRSRTPPGVLFVGLLALAIITVLTLFSAFARGSLAAFVAVVCNLVLLFGLLLGQRWAYALAILFAIAGTTVAFMKNPSQGLFALLGNALVVVPVLVSTHYFFPDRTEADSTGTHNR